MKMINTGKPGTSEYGIQQMHIANERMKDYNEQVWHAHMNALSARRQNSSSEFKFPWVVRLGFWIVAGYFLLKLLGW
jgi:hypothetical protein